jgi:hypothetical protein
MALRILWPRLQGGASGTGILEAPSVQPHRPQARRPYRAGHGAAIAVSHGLGIMVEEERMIGTSPPTSLEALAYANRSSGTVSGLNW